MNFWKKLYALCFFFALVCLKGSPIVAIALMFYVYLLSKLFDSVCKMPELYIELLFQWGFFFDLTTISLTVLDISIATLPSNHDIHIHFEHSAHALKRQLACHTIRGIHLNTRAHTKTPTHTHIQKCTRNPPILDEWICGLWHTGGKIRKQILSFFIT